MKQISIPLAEIRCRPSRYNSIEVNSWKNIFLAKKPIPSPHINKRKEVIAFYSSYFVLKEIGIKEIMVVTH